MITPELIEEFRGIFREEYGRELTLQEAREMGNALVDSFSLLQKNYYQLDQNKHESNTDLNNPQ